MDIKHKVDETYKTESFGRKKKILVALSGGIDSYVAAYLLKIQKYELIGATVVTGWENYSGDQAEVLSCVISNEKLESIREFCHQLNIPHVTIKAANEFQEEVVEAWTASRMTATLGRPCWNCHSLRLKLLFGKMQEMGASTLATGHFAKLFIQEHTRAVAVHTSNDEQHDQSGLLSRLPNEILSCLMLPLSDLQKKEVLKLSENFGLVATEKKIKIHECFPTIEDTTKYLESRIPEKYRPIGEILDPEASNKFGDHSGAFKHAYGSLVETITSRANPMYVCKYTSSDKVLNIDTEEGFKKNKVLLVHCETPEDTSWPEPMKGYIQFGIDTYVECWVYPKSLNAALVEWETPQKVFEGEIISVLKKKGKNAKVFFTGKVRYVQADRLPPPDQLNHEDKNAKKVDHRRDF